jgi:hypothetical protein
VCSSVHHAVVAVLGIDACRAGWGGIVLGDDGSVRGAFDLRLGRLLDEVEATYGRPAAIGVDSTGA